MLLPGRRPALTVDAQKAFSCGKWPPERPRRKTAPVNKKESRKTFAFVNVHQWHVYRIRENSSLQLRV
jgi:hypothetical protein